MILEREPTLNRKAVDFICGFGSDDIVMSAANFNFGDFRSI